ncbi:hypothetical protein SCP_0115530 [Sparassis crispa]|uniref:Uncharacterized protein n=1 Tax=Sparassis crispa TaxID=139825 RepID=A0A401G926_9APHY|nr:hypothetical protein SCP_0115530 [Sparassis crispa]GBE78662.1 hypothetical protein SCP_0115530 [Sparassis crispa]
MCEEYASLLGTNRLNAPQEFKLLPVDACCMRCKGSMPGLSYYGILNKSSKWCAFDHFCTSNRYKQTLRAPGGMSDRV